jgi:hypothetical protein
VFLDADAGGGGEIFLRMRVRETCFLKFPKKKTSPWGDSSKLAQVETFSATATAATARQISATKVLPPPPPPPPQWFEVARCYRTVCNIEHARCSILGKSIAIKNTTLGHTAALPYTQCISTSALSIQTALACPHTVGNWFVQLMPLHA